MWVSQKVMKPTSSINYRTSGRTRTYNLLIMIQLLYHLSYRGASAFSLIWGGRVREVRDTYIKPRGLLVLLPRPTRRNPRLQQRNHLETLIRQTTKRPPTIRGLTVSSRIPRKIPGENSSPRFQPSVQRLVQALFAKPA